MKPEEMESECKRIDQEDRLRINTKFSFPQMWLMILVWALNVYFDSEMIIVGGWQILSLLLTFKHPQPNYFFA